MGLTHIRTPKNFDLDERLERYASAIETNAPGLAGRWAQACWPIDPERPDGPDRFREVALDLGCGKGAFIAQCAQQHPDTLFIGMDVEPICIAYAAQRACDEGLRNMVIVPRGADALPEIFCEGELSAITLNFPTPYPKRHHARRRLVNVDHLVGFRRLLAPGSTITLRTDSQPLWEYAKGQFEAAGYTTLWISSDTHADHPETPVTEYERRLTERGATVFGICATLGAEPDAASIQRGRDAEQSLMCYLPADLSTLDYVPLGMEAAVENFRNRERKGKARIPGDRRS